MKILFITAGSSLLGGVERHLLTLAVALHKQQIEVSVCCGATYGPLCDALKSEGIQTYTLNSSNGHTFSLLKRFKAVLREVKPDIIHGHLMPFFVMVAIRLYARHIPLVITRHFSVDSNEKKTLRRSLFELLEYSLTRKNNSLCYVSYGSRKSDLKAPHNAPVIYNPIDLTPLPKPTQSLHEILQIPSNVPLIGAATRIVNVKNPLALTRVILTVLNQHPTAHGVIIGNGDPSILQAIKDEIATHQSHTRFHLIDARDDAPILLQNLDCFVMTSHSEGLPTALLNALHARVPLAFMNGIGGLEDLTQLNEGQPFGKVVPQGEETSLAQAILHLLKHPEERERYCQNGKKLLEKLFDIRVILPQLLALYQRLLPHTAINSVGCNH